MSNQMTLTDRIAIEAGIAAGKTFKEIAAKIHRNPATISREIKQLYDKSLSLPADDSHYIVSVS